MPVFGDRPIDEITPGDIQKFLNSRKDHAHKTLLEEKQFMGQIFKAAAEDGLIEKDPTSSRRNKIPSDKQEVREALPIEQFREIISNLDKLEMRARRFLALVAFSGIRHGEALDLRWEDIDREAGVIHIRQAVTFDGNRPIVGTTKTKSGKRDIPLDDCLLKMLEPMEQSGFVVSGEAPLTKTMDRNMWNNKIKKVINLHGAAPHILRHPDVKQATKNHRHFQALLLWQMAE